MTQLKLQSGNKLHCLMAELAGQVKLMRPKHAFVLRLSHCITQWYTPESTSLFKPCFLKPQIYLKGIYSSCSSCQEKNYLNVIQVELSYGSLNSHSNHFPFESCDQHLNSATCISIPFLSQLSLDFSPTVLLLVYAPMHVCMSNTKTQLDKCTYGQFHI